MEFTPFHCYPLKKPKNSMRSLLILLLFSTIAHAQLRSDGATASFKGSLPPKPTADLSTDQIRVLESRLDAIRTEFKDVKQHPRAADVEIFIKAVRYAIEFSEWYDKSAEVGFKKAQAILDEATNRIEALKKNQTPWLEGSGQKVLGFYSKIDGSAQPYGVEISDDLSTGQDQPSVPMWIWLHGRGDTSTDLHFISSRLNAKKPGQFQPKGTIVIHPFGRYCNGWKSAGETDVFEARDNAIARFNVDQNRIAIAGFSMGGAGAWHLGAHFADQWACVHTGAGFVDVKRYQKLTPDKMPAWFEQKLWGVYDVPDYARNFQNVPLVSYSGEIDPQRDAADYMMEILNKEGIHPPHLIGPGMGHKYHPEVIRDVQSKIEAAVAKGKEPMPTKVVLQTRTLAYNRLYWLEISEMEKMWEDTRAEADWNESENVIRASTKNINRLIFHVAKKPRVFVNGVEALGNQISGSVKLGWSWDKNDSVSTAKLVKKPKLQGPIEDGFKSRFVVVMPDASPDGSLVDQWVRAEALHFLVRWRSLMRGDAVLRTVNELSEDDIQQSHLVVWGTPRSNSLISKLIVDNEISKVLTWDEKVVKIGSQQRAADHCVPVLCYPNPLNPNRYVIFNSGLTFREAHDRTNSLQNPKLPDWSILDITQPPNAESPGKILAADFFDAHWKTLPRVKLPTDLE